MKYIVFISLYIVNFCILLLLTIYNASWLHMNLACNGVVYVVPCDELLYNLEEKNETQLVGGNSHQGHWDFRAQPSCEHVTPVAPLKNNIVKMFGFCLLLLVTSADIGLL